MIPKLKKFRKANKAITKLGAALVLVILLIVSAFGSYLMTGTWFGIGAPSGGTGGTGTGGTGTGGTGTGTVSPSTWAGPLYMSVVDAVTGGGVTTSTTTVDQVGAENGAFDFLMGPQKSVAQSANPQSESRIWNQGDQVIVMVDCTGNPSNGLDYYPAMYYMQLYQGAPIYELTDARCFDGSAGAYHINTQYATALSQTVQQYESSNVKYWNIGDLRMYPRQAAADVDLYLTYGGTTLAKVTDASTWVDTAAEITANATLASDLETAQLKMIGANANVGWGKHFFVVNQQGVIEEYGAVVVVTTDMVAIKVPSGWNSITMSTLYAEKGFYKVLDADTISSDLDVSGAMMPAKGSKPSWTVDIDIDATSAAASTAYLFRFWIEDSQKLADVGAVGTSTGVPTAYGFVTSYGVGAVVHNTALTITSGAGDTEQLQAYLTTAA